MALVVQFRLQVRVRHSQSTRQFTQLVVAQVAQLMSAVAPVLRLVQQVDQVLSLVVAVEMVQEVLLRAVVLVRAEQRFQLPEHPQFTVRVVAAEDTTAQADLAAVELQMMVLEMAVATPLLLQVALALPTQVAVEVEVEREMLQVVWVDLV
jgi:hypothetical protein